MHEVWKGYISPLYYLSKSGMEAEAFEMLEKDFSEEWSNEAYSLVLEHIGKFIEKNNLRSTNFPKRANSALYVLALGVAKKNLVFSPEEAAKYLDTQLERILDGGYDIVEQIFEEIKRG
ncbi:MAG: hypothetical protein QXP61_07660 [Nitrososphaerales archaeon]